MNLTDKRDLALLKEKFSENELAGAIKRVENGEPLAYVIGEWYFYGLTFKLNDACLIPRPDTEHIVEKAIETLPKNGKFIDLCTGSGCIAISVLKNRPDLTAYALDISEKAIEAAKENATLNGVRDRLTLLRADIFKFDANTLTALDAVISNPPYIQSSVVPTLEVAKCEPVTALDCGEDGMDFYRFIVQNYKNKLTPNGKFIFEIGYDQKKDITTLANEHDLICQIYKDYGGNDRVSVIETKQNTL